MLLESGAGTEADIARAREEAHGLGLFVRSLVGLDREAATEAFDRYLVRHHVLGQPAPVRPADRRAPDRQRRRWRSPGSTSRRSPTTHPTGPDMIFTDAQVDDIVADPRRGPDHALPDVTVA